MVAELKGVAKARKGAGATDTKELQHFTILFFDCGTGLKDIKTYDR